jgi:hypothetical protein
MAETVFPPPASFRSAGLGGIRRRVGFALAIWLTFVVSLGAAGVFVGRPGAPPLAMATGIVAPLLLFFAWRRLSRSFRDFTLSLDLRLTAGMQAWRWMGVGFLFLYAYKVLPAMFAVPAGLGDMAIGVTAPWIVLALARQPGFAASAAFTRWNVLGMLDLAVALGLGAALSMRPPGEISTAPMATLPLLLVPLFLVPLFLMLHAAALMRSRRPG